MRARIVLLVIIVAALICLGFTREYIKCYSCVYTTGRLPSSVLKEYENNPKCADPSGSGMTSLKAADDWVSYAWMSRVFLDPLVVKKESPDNTNTILLYDLTPLFESPLPEIIIGLPKFAGNQSRDNEGECSVLCLTATGESENEDIGKVTVRGFFAYSPVTQINMGCTSVGDSGKVCICDTSECNDQGKSAPRSSAASGLEVAFGLIAVAAVEVAMMSKLIS